MVYCRNSRRRVTQPACSIRIQYCNGLVLSLPLLWRTHLSASKHGKTCCVAGFTTALAGSALTPYLICVHSMLLAAGPQARPRPRVERAPGARRRIGRQARGAAAGKCLHFDVYVDFEENNFCAVRHVWHPLLQQGVAATWFFVCTRNKYNACLSGLDLAKYSFRVSFTCSPIISFSNLCASGSGPCQIVRRAAYRGGRCRGDNPMPSIPSISIIFVWPCLCGPRAVIGGRRVMLP